MAIIAEIEEKQQIPTQNQNLSSSSASLPFNALLDPSNPLAFLESTFVFLSENTNLFKKDTSQIEKKIASMIRGFKEKGKALAEAEKKKKEEKNKPNKNLLVPNKGNGLDMENYSWTQTLDEVTVNVPVPSGTKSSLINCCIKKKNLQVGIKNQSAPIIDGELFNNVKVEDSFWSLEDNKMVSILLTKIDKIDWWKYLIKGGPEIDTQKAEPGSSRLSDLDLETRSMVEKSMFDQRQKAMGLPTSQKIEQDEMMKKFMAQNPQMANNMNFQGPYGTNMFN